MTTKTQKPEAAVIGADSVNDIDEAPTKEVKLEKFSYLEKLKFRDYFDKDKVVTSSDPVNRIISKKDKTPFADDGIFSEEIFGVEQDPETVENMGWIDFKGVYIVNPIFFDRVGKIFKRSRFIDMISYDKKISANGKIRPLTDEDKEMKGSFPHQNMGLKMFKDHFMQLMRDDVPTPMKRTQEYRAILNAYMNGTLFVDCFPIFSAKLRPGQVTKDREFRFSEINNYYNFLIKHSNEIKAELGSELFDDDNVQLQILNLNFNLQMDAYNIVTTVINDMLKDKSGVFRKLISGSRINFSARNVIGPEPSNRIDEVSMNYVTFAKLYEPLLINLVKHARGISFNDANLFVHNAQNHFSKELYRYMCELVEKTRGGMHIILNRKQWIAA